MIRQTMLCVLSAAVLNAFSGGASSAVAQGTQPKVEKGSDAIPRGFRPPAGMCRIWVDGVPAAQQPAPTDCPSAVKNKPANARVIYGESADKKGKNGLDRLEVKSFVRPGKGVPPIPPEQLAASSQARDSWE